MNRNKNKTFNWVKDEMKEKIIIDGNILDYKNSVIGIYGIFIRDEKENCIYVGRTCNMYSRIFSVDGHLGKLKKVCENETEKNKIEKYIDIMYNSLKYENTQIIIKLLESVTLDYENYNKDMQKLASSENYHIDYYQNRGQCLYQLPEGSNMKYKYWEYESKKLI